MAVSGRKIDTYIYIYLRSVLFLERIMELRVGILGCNSLEVAHTLFPDKTALEYYILLSHACKREILDP